MFQASEPLEKRTGLPQPKATTPAATLSSAVPFRDYDLDGLLGESIDVYRLSKPSVTGEWERAQQALRGSPHHITAARCVDQHNAFVQCVEAAGKTFSAWMSRRDGGRGPPTLPSVACLKELTLFERCADGVATEFDRRLQAVRVEAMADVSSGPHVPSTLRGKDSLSPA
jgi:hypothetical protein